MADIVPRNDLATGIVWGQPDSPYYSTTNLSGEGSPPGDASFVGLTTERVNRINAQADAGWPVWDKFVARIENRTSLVNDDNNARNMAQAVGVLIATGKASANVQSWWRNEYANALTEFLIGPQQEGPTADTLRQSSVDFCLNFQWIEKHQPTFWSASERSTFRAQLVEIIQLYHQEWFESVYTKFEDGTNSKENDSDRIISMANLGETASQLGFLTTSLQSDIEFMRDELLQPQYLGRLFDPTYGVMIQSAFESASYSSNSMRFALEWIDKYFIRTGGYPYNYDHATGWTRNLLLCLVADKNDLTSTGGWGVRRFHDSLNDPTKSREAYSSFGPYFRMANILYNGLLVVSNSSDEYRVLIHVINTSLAAYGDESAGHFQSTSWEMVTQRILTEDTDLSTPLEPENSSLPMWQRSVGAEGWFVGVSDKTLKDVVLNYECQQLTIFQHCFANANSFSIKYKGQIITDYQNTKDVVNASGRLNIAYIQNNPDPDENNNYQMPAKNGNTVVGLPMTWAGASFRSNFFDNSDYFAVWIADYSSTEYQVASSDCAGLWAIYDQNFQGFGAAPFIYVTKDARLVFNLVDFDTKMCLVVDKIVTDAAAVNDNIVTARERQIVNRFQAEPTLSSGRYSTSYDNVTVWYENLLSGTVSIYVEDQQSNLEGGVEGPAGVYTGPSNKWSLENSITAHDTETAYVLFYGDTGTASFGVMNGVTINSGSVNAWHVTGPFNVVIVVPTDPTIPIDTTVDVTSSQSLTGARVYFCGLDSASQFTIANPSGNRITCTPGTGDFPNSNSKVLRGDF